MTPFVAVWLALHSPVYPTTLPVPIEPAQLNVDVLYAERTEEEARPLRIIDTPRLHFMVRPNLDALNAVALTLQLTVYDGL